jgi:hypothetical protein
MRIVENFLLVFRNRNYIILSAVITILLAFLLGFLMQIVFISPKFIISLAGVPAFDLIFLSFVSIASGITISMSAYRLMALRAPFKTGNNVGFFSTMGSLFVGACTCSTVLLTLLSVSGVMGAAVLGFVYQYLTPIRILMVIILGFSFYSTANNLTVGCRIKLK